MEKNEIEELEAEMKKLNVYFVNKADIDSTKKYFVIEADIDCEIQIDFMKEFALTKKVMRGSVYYVTFEKLRLETLTMRIGVELPKDFENVYGKADFGQLPVIATTFMDLCWIHSDGTTSQTLNEVSTVLRDGAQLGDLTWVLPSKFVDDFVEMMHTLNQSIISGLMQDAFLYGPFIFSKEEIY